MNEDFDGDTDDFETYDDVRSTVEIEDEASDAEPDGLIYEEDDAYDSDDSVEFDPNSCHLSKDNSTDHKSNTSKKYHATKRWTS